MRFKIGELAKLAGCPVVTIRFYEKEGLLDKPERDKSNYRLYSEDDASRLRFILHCRKHGIKLADIRKLLALREQPAGDCAFAHKLIADQLNFVEEQIESLEKLEEELAQLARHGHCGGRCRILEELDAADDCPYCEKLGRKIKSQKAR